MAESQVNHYLNNAYNDNRYLIHAELNEGMPAWNTPTWEAGAEFSDRSKNGKDRNWRKRKLGNLSIYDAFEVMASRGEISNEKSDRVYLCSDVLMYELKPKDEYPKLKKAFFCKNKLCPICSWRRALKHSYVASKVIDKALKKHPKASFLFLTLTVKNCDGVDLKDELRYLTKSFDRLFKRKKVKRNLIGYLRSTEVTYNSETKQYHPHFHVLLMVKSSYFKGTDNYINKDEWVDMWQQSLKVGYKPSVDIQSIKPGVNGLKRAVIETAKYPLKPLNFKEIGDDEIVNVVSTLYHSLANARQLAYGGLLREIYRDLRIDEENLVNVDDEATAEEETVGKLLFAAFDYKRRNYYWMKRV